MKCRRCRRVYDPIGSDDTDVLPDLAGVATARRVLARRAGRKRQGLHAGRTRRRAPEPAVGILIEVTTAPQHPWWMPDPEPVPEPTPPEVQEPASVPAEPAAHVALAERETEPVAVTTPIISLPARPVPVPRKRVRREVEERTDYGLFELNAAAVSVLFLTAGAILCASFEQLTGLVRPLGIASLALGLVAVTTSGLAGR